MRIQRSKQEKEIATKENLVLPKGLRLVDLPLSKAKEYAAALHHFVVNNIDQPHMLEFEEISLKLSRAINWMVDSSTKKQTEISSFFPRVTEMNWQDNEKDA